MLGQTAILLIIYWAVATATPTGNHTCFGVIKHPVTVRVNVTEPVTYRTYTWCLRVPPRCSKYTVQLRDRVKVQTEMHNKTITVCCKGYVEMDYKCVPACPPFNECPNMHCNRTNHCYCTPGYMGLYCNEPCHRGFWGKDCQRPCDCPEGYTCHHLTGDCMLDDAPPKRAPPKTETHRVTQLNPIEISEALKAESTKSSERPATKVSTTQMTTTPPQKISTTKKNSIELGKATTVEPEKHAKAEHLDEIEATNFRPIKIMIKSTTLKPSMESKALDPGQTPGIQQVTPEKVNVTEHAIDQKEHNQNITTQRLTTNQFFESTKNTVTVITKPTVSTSTEPYTIKYTRLPETNNTLVLLTTVTVGKETFPTHPTLRTTTNEPSEHTVKITIMDQPLSSNESTNPIVNTSTEAYPIRHTSLPEITKMLATVKVSKEPFTTQPTLTSTTNEPLEYRVKTTIMGNVLSGNESTKPIVHTSTEAYPIEHTSISEITKTSATVNFSTELFTTQPTLTSTTNEPLEYRVETRIMDNTLPPNESAKPTVHTFTEAYTIKHTSSPEITKTLATVKVNKNSFITESTFRTTTNKFPEYGVKTKILDTTLPVTESADHTPTEVYPLKHTRLPEITKTQETVAVGKDFLTSQSTLRLTTNKPSEHRVETTVMDNTFSVKKSAIPNFYTSTEAYPIKHTLLPELTRILGLSTTVKDSKEFANTQFTHRSTTNEPTEHRVKTTIPNNTLSPINAVHTSEINYRNTNKPTITELLTNIPTTIHLFTNITTPSPNYSSTNVLTTSETSTIKPKREQSSAKMTEKSRNKFKTDELFKVGITTENHLITNTTIEHLTSIDNQTLPTTLNHSITVATADSYSIIKPKRTTTDEYSVHHRPILTTRNSEKQPITRAPFTMKMPEPLLTQLMTDETSKTEIKTKSSPIEHFTRTPFSDKQTNKTIMNVFTIETTKLDSPQTKTTTILNLPLATETPHIQLNNAEQQTVKVELSATNITRSTPFVPRTMTTTEPPKTKSTVPEPPPSINEFTSSDSDIARIISKPIESTPLLPMITEPGRTTKSPHPVRITAANLWLGRGNESASNRSTKPTLTETIARKRDKEITTQETPISKNYTPKGSSAFSGKSGEDENNIMKLLVTKTPYKNSRLDTLSHPTLKSEAEDNILNLSHILNGINELISNNNMKENDTEKTTNYSIIKLPTTTEKSFVNDQMRKTINIYELKSDNEQSDSVHIKPIEKMNLNENRLETNSTVADVQSAYSRNRLNTEESKDMIDLLKTEPLSAGVQSKQSDEAVRHFLSGLTFTLGCITTITIIILTLVIFRKCRNKRDKCMMDEVIMAYSPPSESTNPLIYNNSNYSVLRFGEGQPTFFCPTFTNTYAERLNRELNELNYDHPRSIAEPLYAEISN